jgi:CheY-like chemotaxis protein
VQELMKIVLGKRIGLSLWVEEGLAAVMVDSSELDLGVIGLALNARDALSPGGQVGMHARLADERETQGLSGGSFVAISLTDTGSGVDLHALEHIFEPFFTTKAAGKGTGLGLSQVHGFCKQAGGTALVASTAGMGTTVSLILPATDEQPGSGVSRAPAVQSSAIAGKRLLLVEDNADLGDSAAALLESFGCVVQRSSDAAQALRRIEQGQHFDMVLSDVVMPGDLDGLAMARQLRERWPSLPIVLISGYSSALAEARDFVVLAKPCAPSHLLAALTRAVAPAPAVT